MPLNTNVALLTALFFNRIKSDPQGGIVRSALGAGADSVLRTYELVPDTESAVPLVLPTRPIVAMHMNALTESERALYLGRVTWYIYDDPVQGYWRVSSLVSMISGAYASVPLRSASGRLFGDLTVPFISDELPDQKLGLYFRYLQVAVPFLSGR